MNADGSSIVDGPGNFFCYANESIVQSFIMQMTLLCRDYSLKKRLDNRLICITKNCPGPSTILLMALANETSSYIRMNYHIMQSTTVISVAKLFTCREG